MKNQEHIILVHGLFMSSVIMSYMKSKLSNLGYQVESFSYPTIKKSVDENVNNLIIFAKKYQQRIIEDYELDDNKTANNSAPIIHFVGHSLGGLVIRCAYEKCPELFTGKIVTLGTPHQGSLVAKMINDKISDRFIKESYINALDGHLPAWKGDIELGSISGNIPLGVGLVYQTLPRPNDGTVAVIETQLENLTDQITLPLSHTTLVYSAKACEQIDYFIKNSRFNHS